MITRTRLQHTLRRQICATASKRTTTSTTLQPLRPQFKQSQVQHLAGNHNTAPALSRPLHSTLANMGSDEDYEAFLNKANEDVSGTTTQSTKTSNSKSKSVNTSSVPAPLQKVDAYYTTDSDEPFEPVALEYSGKDVPSAQELGDLVGKEVESISKKEFEAGGSYGDVVEAVEKATKGKVGYFRVNLGGTRSEVWVVGVDGKGSLVGLKAVAILS